MAKRSGIESHQEWQSKWVYRDARPMPVRLADWMSNPKNLLWVVGGVGFTGGAAPAMAIPSLFIAAGIFAWWEAAGSKRKQLPLQIPTQAGLIDHSEIDPKTRRPTKGAGILYLGNNRSLSGFQEECWVNNSQARTHFLMAGTTGSGKALRLSEDIPTPHGFVKMRDIREGDWVIHPSGRPTYVEGVFPQGDLPLYRVSFGDGRSIDVSGDHLWEIHHKHWNGRYQKGVSRAGQAQPKVLTTVELLEQLDACRKGAFYVPLFTPEGLEDAPAATRVSKLPVHPYLLGVMTWRGVVSGDGVSLQEDDPDVLDQVAALVPGGFAGAPALCRALIDQGVGVAPHQRRLPAAYFSASVSDRLALLRGLLDAGGVVGKAGGVTFSTVSAELAADVVRLTRSLGGIARATKKSSSYVNRTGDRGRDVCRVSIRFAKPELLFSSRRKRSRVEGYQYQDTLKLRVVGVEALNRSEPCQCIKVASPDGLFVAGDYIVTHNTMTLLGMVANALAWGSGCIYVDGKADNSLFFNMYSLARRMGRDDSVFVLNFMTGGQDIFSMKKDGTRRSNTFNPFSRGAADDFIQLMVSLMPQAGGDNAMWQGLAVGMIDAVIRGLCLRRAERGLEIDPGVIRDAIEMNSILEMAREFQMLEPGSPKYELVFRPIKAYLINLPGLEWSVHVDGGDPVEVETKKQHDFRSMQFLRQLTMIADTYGKVFRQQIPEVDMLDIILNNRVLVVMIPSMEKSEEESGAVGKLVVTALRMIMALNLGDKVEGMYDDAVESKATNSNSPFLCILDELGYYFTKGLAVIFAQARSLGFSMVAAMQDFPALMKGPNKEEAESVIANTKFKESLAMEDSEKTAEFFLKTAGKAIVTEVSGYSGDVGVGAASYRDRMDASVQERDRVTLQELRDMDTTDSILMWRDRITRMATFAPFISGAKAVKKFPVRLNRLLGLHPPNIAGGRDDLYGFAEAEGGEQRNVQLLMEQFVAGVISANFEPKEAELDMPIRQLGLICGNQIEEATEMSGKDVDFAMFAQVFRLLELQRHPPVVVPDEEEAGGSSSGGGPVLKPRPEAELAADDDLDSAVFAALQNAGSGLVGDEIDAADYLDSAPSLPVEVASAPMETDVMDAQAFTDATDDLNESIARAVMDAEESIVVKPAIRESLERVDSILSAKPPGSADEASQILMDGVTFVPAKPLAEPVDQASAKMEIEDIMADILSAT